MIPSPVFGVLSFSWLPEVTVLPELLFLVAPITLPPVTAVPPPVTVVAEPLPLLLLDVSVEPLVLELFPESAVDSLRQGSGS